jgi:hypothetical protein
MSHYGLVVTLEEVRALALTLPRTTEHLIRDRVKFRVKQLVYVAFSRDETLMGFGFPKEERDALIAMEPAKFLLPPTSDLRYNWVVVRLAEIDRAEMVERVTEAWTMVVPKKVAAEHLGA